MAECNITIEIASFAPAIASFKRLLAVINPMLSKKHLRRLRRIDRRARRKAAK